MTTSTAWMDQAACADYGPALFFPTGNPWAKSYRAQADAAARVCQRCPVRVACRSAATQRHEHHGVWGGHDYGAQWAPTGRRRRPVVIIIRLTGTGA